MQVQGIIGLHKRIALQHETEDLKEVEVSVDGVNECNSTSRSLEILSLRFVSCRNIYVSMIARPQVFHKVSQKQTFECYLTEFIEELNDLGLRISLVVMDAPERSTCRKQKQHGGFYSCDTCYANPENYQTPGRTGCMEFLTFTCYSI